MKPRLIALSALLMTSIALGQGPAAQMPLPVDQIPVPPPRAAPPAAATPVVVAGPATQPVMDGVNAGSKVVILPFEILGDSVHRDWVARAMQQSLSAEVARIGGLDAISAAAPARPVDSAAASDVAKTYGGDVVVFGAFQSVGPEDVRFTGQVMDVATGKSLAGLKASGDFRDLFALEDQLAAQLHRALRPAPAVATNAPNDNSMIFSQPVPALTAADFYAPAYSPQFADAYQRYYYDWSDYNPYVYGLGFYGGYGGFNGGFDGHRDNHDGHHDGHGFGGHIGGGGGVGAPVGRGAP